jgi:sugar lactone lactonase YvrE
MFRAFRIGSNRARRQLPKAHRSRSLGLEVLEDRVCLSANLFVADALGNAVREYDGISGAFLNNFASNSKLHNPEGLEFGPDGNLYVGGYFSNNVVRFDGTTGQFIDTFATGIAGSIGVHFGPDGNLYVGSYGNSQVLRFDGTSGNLIDVFASGGGLNGAMEPVFGPDGNLYVTSHDSNSVIRYDGITGQFIDTFVSPGSGGLVVPQGLVFGPDGNLYVSSSGTNSVLQYDGATGVFLGTFASGSITYPVGLVFGPDGNLYVSGYDSQDVVRYDGTTGAFIDVFASGGGLNKPTFLTFYDNGSSALATAQVRPTAMGSFGFDALKPLPQSAVDAGSLNKDDPKSAFRTAVPAGAPQEHASENGSQQMNSQARDDYFIVQRDSRQPLGFLEPLSASRLELLATN